MDFTDLQYLIAIDKYRNITDAATNCHVSQSVLSKRLAKLEAELGGITLCNRSKRPIMLTPAGQEFIQYAERITEEYQGMMHAMNKYIVHASNILRIGSIPVMGRMGISEPILRFRDQYKEEIDYTIVDRPSYDLLDMLEDEEIDAAFIILSPKMKLDRKFTTYPLTTNTLKLAVGSNHRFAHRSSINLSELANEHIALQDQKTGMYDLSTRALADAGVSLKNIQTYRNIDTVINATVSGRTVTLLSERLAKSYADAGLRLVTIDRRLQSTMALVIKNTRYINPLLRDFITYMTTEIKDL